LTTDVTNFANNFKTNHVPLIRNTFGRAVVKAPKMVEDPLA